jgi:predicted lipoprotein with Yx(FWY)xxD motif
MRTRTILAMFVAVGVALTACGSDDDDTADSDTTAAAEAESAPDSSSGQDSLAPAGSATVMIATDSNLGEYLVDADGLTLYLFAKDEGTTTACTGGCADNWPPIVADGAPTAGDGIDLEQLGTADGIEPNQVTYYGHLLYYFAGDEAPGDTNGVGLPDWYPVDPAGNAIE